MLSICAQFALAGAIIAAMYLINRRTGAPVLGVYRQTARFYYVKLLAMLLLLRLRPRRRGEPDVIDRPQPLSSHPMAIDAIYFNGSGADRALLAIGTARRAAQRVDGFCVLRVPQFSDRVLVTPKFPDTRLTQTGAEAADLSAVAVEGIQVRPQLAMRSWRLQYTGSMKFEGTDDGRESVQVQLDAQWSSVLPAFNYDVDISALTIARAVAREPWSRDYFQRLERYHQTHYEQYGDVQGTVRIDGVEYGLRVPCVRDHSFAVMRDWRNFHRYVMHFFTLETGDRVSVGVISIPVTFSRIVVGFVTDATSGTNMAISDCDFELYQHGENGIPAKDYAFTFAAGCQKYVVQVQAHTDFEFYIGEGAESRVVELYSDFVVNGVRGSGIAEWQYRNVNGLPGSSSSSSNDESPAE